MAVLVTKEHRKKLEAGVWRWEGQRASAPVALTPSHRPRGNRNLCVCFFHKRRGPLFSGRS